MKENKKLLNVSNQNTSPILKMLLCSAVNKYNKEFQHTSKELIRAKFLSSQLFFIDFYIFNRFIMSSKESAIQKTLNIQKKNVSSLTRSCNLPTFKLPITYITQHKLLQEESSLLNQAYVFHFIETNLQD